VLDNVRMIEETQHFDLSLHLLKDTLLLYFLLVQDLYRHLVPRYLVKSNYSQIINHFANLKAYV
jgi:hypothetical protein